mgnify:CR=1 FL=1
MEDPNEPTSQVDRGIMRFLETLTGFFVAFIIVFNTLIFIVEVTKF